MPKKKQPNRRNCTSRIKTRRSVSIKQDRKVQEKDEVFGFMAGKLEIVGDIESPIPDWFSEERK